MYELICELLFSGIGHSQYVELFSHMLGEHKLIHQNLFYKIEQKYIFPIKKALWETHQKELFNQDSYNILADGRFSRPQKKKGPSKYVTEVIIQEKTNLVIDLFTLKITDKCPNKGNLETQAFFKILEKPPLFGKKINYLICDENLSLISRVNKKSPRN
ncbi:hypothetical protein M0812_23603 [Anaeramoeba flamelloides]|uniref:Transposase n=1 Tax=Anaeramoeba flamelloides TaxID=1746091 RepID=A0AAV7YRN6_9EUKA|nr:hypothetical protein M0812_23603 [Anaeramoeba flamelloides]